MNRSVIITAIRDKRTSAAVAHSLEPACHVHELPVSEFAAITGLIRRTEPDLAIMDLDVAESCLDLERISSPMPFGLVVLASRDGATAVEWLDHGADAYLKQPVSIDEIAAQAMSIVRKREALDPERQAAYEYGGLHVNLQDRRVTQNGRQVQLSSTEFKILRLLVMNAGRTVPHDTLLMNVWGDGYEGDLPLLRSFIRRLRGKLGDNGVSQTYIQTRGQLGYTMPPAIRGDSEMMQEHSRRIQAARRQSEALRLITARTREDALRVRQKVEEQRLVVEQRQLAESRRKAALRDQ